MPSPRPCSGSGWAPRRPRAGEHQQGQVPSARRANSPAMRGARKPVAASVAQLPDAGGPGPPMNAARLGGQAGWAKVPPKHSDAARQTVHPWRPQGAGSHQTPESCPPGWAGQETRGRGGEGATNRRAANQQRAAPMTAAARPSWERGGVAPRESQQASRPERQRKQPQLPRSASTMGATEGAGQLAEPGSWKGAAHRPKLAAMRAFDQWP